MKIACFHDYEKGVRVDVWLDESEPPPYTVDIIKTRPPDQFDFITTGMFNRIQDALKFGMLFIEKFRP